MEERRGTLTGGAEIAGGRTEDTQCCRHHARGAPIHCGDRLTVNASRNAIVAAANPTTPGSSHQYGGCGMNSAARQVPTPAAIDASAATEDARRTNSPPSTGTNRLTPSSV